MHKLSSRTLLSCSILSVVASGCRSYEPAPLDVADVVAQVEASRRAWVPAEQGFDFAQAATALGERGPALIEARAAWSAAAKLAGVKTPLPNPSIEVGPAYGFGPDVLGHRLQPMGSLGWAIPLGGRLARQDDVNAALAEAARVELLVRHREVYLGMRRDFARVALARKRREALAETSQLAKRSAELARKLVKAGGATALDVGLLDIEEAKVRAEALEAEGSEADAEGPLSEELGIHPSSFAGISAAALPVLPAEPPPEEELKAMLVLSHADLARLRTAYSVSEAELELEISKQYPDLNLGFSAEGDPGESKFVIGLTLGIDVPIFDRNQQGIESALGKREGARANYVAAAGRALARVETARRKVLIALARLKLMRDEVEPLARRQLDQATAGMQAGAVDALHVLEVDRSWRDARMEVLDAESDAREAWTDLEAAVGRPLTLFPGELESARPALPVPADASKKEEVK